MNTRARNTRSIFDDSIWYLSLAILLLSGAGASRADDGGEQRLNATSQGQGTQRSMVGGDPVSYFEFEPLLMSGERDKTTRATGQQKTCRGE